MLSNVLLAAVAASAIAIPAAAQDAYTIGDTGLRQEHSKGPSEDRLLGHGDPALAW